MLNTNYKKISQALVLPTIESVISISYYKDNYYESFKGNVYTLYSSKKKSIKIGFDQNLKKESDLNFILVGERIGSEREMKLLKATLKELGHIEKKDDNTYQYSKIRSIHFT